MPQEKTTPAFYSGISEIAETRFFWKKKIGIFLDFRVSFTVLAEYFASWLEPRTINGLKE
jgi:hypothetical protein